MGADGGSLKLCKRVVGFQDRQPKRGSKTLNSLFVECFNFFVFTIFEPA